MKRPEASAKAKGASWNASKKELLRDARTRIGIKAGRPNLDDDDDVKGNGKAGKNCDRKKERCD